MIWIALIVMAYVIFAVQVVQRTATVTGNEQKSAVKRDLQQFKRLKSRRDMFYQEKMRLEDETIKIFALYELTKEVAECMDEQKAFEIFVTTLQQHISFGDLQFLDHADPRIIDLKRDKQFVLFDLKTKARHMGTLALKDVPEKDMEKVKILGHQFALALRRVKLHQEIEKIAITDSLTELFTRKYTLDRLEEEIRRSHRQGKEMSYLMLDVDYFKSINDTYGHLAGDQILREISEIIKNQIREIDIAGRFGGEEFCVVLPDTDLEGARFVAERIREGTEKDKIVAYDAAVQVTVNIGISTFPRDGKRSRDLIERADWSLYKAKKQGRNRVCSYGED